MNSGNSNWLGNDEPTDDFDEQDQEQGEEEYYDNIPEDEQQHQNQQHQQHLQSQQRQQPAQHVYQQHTTYSSGNGPSNSQGFRHYPRQRRDTVDLSQLELESKLKCNRTECAHIRCLVSNLEKDSSAWIALRMRLVTQTLNTVSESAFNESNTLFVTLRSNDLFLSFRSLPTSH